MPSVVLGKWLETDKPELLASVLRGRVRALFARLRDQRYLLGEACDFRVQYHASQTWLVCDCRNPTAQLDLIDPDDDWMIREDLLAETLVIDRDDSDDTDLADE